MNIQKTDNRALFTRAELQTIDDLGYHEESHAAVIAAVLGSE